MESKSNHFIPSYSSAQPPPELQGQSCPREWSPHQSLKILSWSNDTFLAVKKTLTVTILTCTTATDVLHRSTVIATQMHNLGHPQISKFSYSNQNLHWGSTNYVRWRVRVVVMWNTYLETKAASHNTSTQASPPPPQQEERRTLGSVTLPEQLIERSKHKTMFADEYELWLCGTLVCVQGTQTTAEKVSRVLTYLRTGHSWPGRGLHFWVAVWWLTVQPAQRKWKRLCEGGRDTTTAVGR